MSAEIVRSQFSDNIGEFDGETDLFTESSESVDNTETGIQVNARKTSLDLEFSDPGKLMLLFHTLYDTCSYEIQKKINHYLCHVTKSETVFMIQNPSKTQDAYINVLGQHVIFPEIRLRCKEAIVERPFSSELPIIFKEDVNEKLTTELNKVLSSEFKILMVVPVIHPISMEVVILVGIVNFREEPNCKYDCDGFVNNVYGLFDVIRSEVCDLTGAERCSIYLTDEDGFLSTKILDYGSSFEINKGAVRQIRIPIGEGISGLVGKTGKIYNCDNVDTEVNYDGVLDEAAGFQTRNLLAFPVIFEFNLIGVIELQNKLFGDYFTADDEITVTAMSALLCHAITQGLMHKKLTEVVTRNTFTNKIVLHQLRDCDDLELDSVEHCTDDHNYENFTDFNTLPKSIPEEHTVCVCLKVFNEFGISAKYNIKHLKLIRFLVLCKRGYHDVAVHNWYHAFSTFHFVFLLTNNLYLVENQYITSFHTDLESHSRSVLLHSFLGPNTRAEETVASVNAQLLEVFALLIASLCHSLGYAASLSQFQQRTGTGLASLYSSPGSIAQNYHVSQALHLLTAEECSIAEHLDNDEFQVLANLVSKMIMATDVAEFLRKKSSYKEMIDAGYDGSNHVHRQNMNSLIMTCADLSDYTKSWDYCKDLAELTFQDYFKQENPDRSSEVLQTIGKTLEKGDIPNLQVEFMTEICYPAFSLLTDLFPVLNSCLGRVLSNIDGWQALKATMEEDGEREDEGGSEGDADN
ncbi:hypothetical protein AAG570_006800 [Ranatra chinensis]|uniref:3',5'-cyclic-GMP phosphodiesterase n=1 Tax=Ranatra chinensis TaxID=642074 RepID=A0ABD0ZGD0_9HEMI